MGTFPRSVLGYGEREPIEQPRFRALMIQRSMTLRENELADLLMRMAADRGIDVETATEELASIALPSFVDSRQFRNALVQTLETSLRAQVEERLQSIRRRFDVAPQMQATPPARPAVAPPISVARHNALPSAAPTDGVADLGDATMTDLTVVSDATNAEQAAVVEEELPTDATMVWTTRHG